MTTIVRSGRRKQVVAWAVLGLFLLGFFYAPVATWTGPTLGAWFVGTQRLRRGFLWMMGFALLFALPGLALDLRHSSTWPTAAYAGWTLLAAVVGVLPFTFHRMASRHLRGVISTLPLPFYAATLAAWERAWLPPGIDGFPTRGASSMLHEVGAALGATALVFLVYWFATVTVWMWNHEFRPEVIRKGAMVFAAAIALAVGFGAFRQIRGYAMPPAPALGAACTWVCVAGAVLLSGWALLSSTKDRGWKCSPETLRILQSPTTGEPLRLVRQDGGELLASASGERFPIHGGIADLRRSEDLTGLNQKYNHLYETIGGLYDDAQRVGCALSGIDRDAYVMSYLGALEIKAGDSVLETSVGTGLNFKYLPRGVRLCGIDLASEMLANCRSNLRRWRLEADLFLGNAEGLPFADASFDVVFHCGGINFFNDRAKAIREMIRVAKPGSLILIADETEEHVKTAFERAPITGKYFKNRKESVAAPVDLVPPEMREIRVEILNVIGKNRFYALTFRKPASDATDDRACQSATAPCAPD